MPDGRPTRGPNFDQAYADAHKRVEQLNTGKVIPSADQVALAQQKLARQATVDADARVGRSSALGEGYHAWELTEAQAIVKASQNTSGNK